MRATLENGTIKVEFDVGQVNQDILSFLSFLETTNKSDATEKEVWQLSEDIKADWWRANKERLLNENRR